jgi:hypothetical protein
MSIGSEVLVWDVLLTYCAEISDQSTECLVSFYSECVSPPAAYKEVYLLFCMVVKLGYQRKRTKFPVDKCF